MNPNVLLILFPECGKGFQFVPGQGDHALGTYSHLSTRKCADICNLLEKAEENTHCCSYELDHEEKKCVVNQVLQGANFSGLLRNMFNNKLFAVKTIFLLRGGKEVC